MRHLNAACSEQVCKFGGVKCRYSLGAKWPLIQISFNAKISSRLHSKVQLSTNLKLKRDQKKKP